MLHQRLYDETVRRAVVHDYVTRGLSITEIRTERGIGRSTIHKFLVCARVKMRPIGMPRGMKLAPRRRAREARSQP